MASVQIDEILKNFTEDEIVVLETPNPTTNDILMAAISTPAAKAVKYMCQHILDIDPQGVKDNRYQFPCPTNLVDLITNIRCNYKFSLVFHYDQEVPCNTDNLTLPMFALMYCPTSLSIELPYEVIVSRVIIRYDAYTLETSLRNKWFTSDIVNGEGMLFSEGTFQKVMH
jgi:hypothetical protein